MKPARGSKSAKWLQTAACPTWGFQMFDDTFLQGRVDGKSSQSWRGKNILIVISRERRTMLVVGNA